MSSHPSPSDSSAYPESPFLCQGCRRPLPSGNQRYSFKFQATHFPGDWKLGQMPDNLEELINSVMVFPWSNEPIWIHHRFFLCTPCRKNLLFKFFEIRGVDGNKKGAEHQVFLLLESTLGFDEISLAEEDLKTDFSQEMEEILENLKNRSSEEMRQEIHIREKVIFSPDQFQIFYHYLINQFLSYKSLGGSSQSLENALH